MMYNFSPWLLRAQFLSFSRQQGQLTYGLVFQWIRQRETRRRLCAILSKPSINLLTNTSRHPKYTLSGACFTGSKPYGRKWLKCASLQTRLKLLWCLVTLMYWRWLRGTRWGSKASYLSLENSHWSAWVRGQVDFGMDLFCEHVVRRAVQN